jgi:hypothetical protein
LRPAIPPLPELDPPKPHALLLARANQAWGEDPGRRLLNAASTSSGRTKRSVPSLPRRSRPRERVTSARLLAAEQLAELERQRVPRPQHQERAVAPGSVHGDGLQRRAAAGLPRGVVQEARPVGGEREREGRRLVHLRVVVAVPRDPDGSSGSFLRARIFAVLSGFHRVGLWPSPRRRFL